MTAIDRFLRYVTYDTQSDEHSDAIPSTAKQKVLGAALAEELAQMGLHNAHMDEYGYVYAWLPATAGCEGIPCVGLIAHMDTSPDAPGVGVKPRVVRYEGGDLVLNEEKGIVMRAAEFESLAKYKGQELIVTDGTTLLGADDKAGVAEIMSAVEYLLQHPELPHGRIAVGFTPDEEVGQGADHFDVEGFGAAVAYTVDGGELGELEYENFNAASARIVVLHTAADMSVVEVELGEEAQLELTELFTAEAFAEVSVKQAARSRCRLTTVQLSSANASYRIDLDGADAENELGGVFLAAGNEHCVVKLRTGHNVADCRSNSYIKGVAGGQAVGEFCGMVYVAPDAQRTDARQQSRNILLSRTARITTQPQLEIYADDVKCSHGATVGQMDAEAILYMRQRGLSEAQARRLQIEGFVGDVVTRCGIEPLCGAILERAAAKIETL